MTKPKNDLTAEYVRSRLDYDSDTGIFTWKYFPDARPGWNVLYVGKVAGTTRKDDNGIQICLNGRRYKAHRLAWLHVYGTWPQEQIDHKKGNRPDNKIQLLREATISQNAMNKRPKSGKLKGAFWHKRMNSWRSQIVVAGNRMYLGRFDTEELAHKAYCAAAEKYFGEFARFE